MIPTFIIYGMIASILSGALCSSIGTFMTLRGLIFMGAGVAHAALAGASLALLLGLKNTWAIFGLGLLFSIPLAIIAGYVGERGLKMDNAIGLMFAMDMALAVMIIGMLKEYTVEAWSLIFGDVLGVEDSDMILLVVILGIVEFFLLLFYKEFKFITFDFEGAVASGIRARMTHYLMMIMITLTVVSVLKSVGALLVFSLLVAPPLAAYELSHNIERMLLFSLIIGISASIIGILISLELNTPTSATIALVASLIAIALMLISPKKRCCRRLRGRILTITSKQP